MDLRALTRGPLPERIALAARADARGEWLLLLAGDETTPVRLAAAANPRAPRQADQILARDPAIQVRQAIADTLADQRHAPHDLVLEMARDAEPAVNEPLIRLSQVLTEADLLGLVLAPPGPETRCAVARRLHMDTILAEALIMSRDRLAMTALCRSPSARISPCLRCELEASASTR